MLHRRTSLRVLRAIAVAVLIGAATPAAALAQDAVFPDLMHTAKVGDPQIPFDVPEGSSTGATSVSSANGVLQPSETTPWWIAERSEPQASTALPLSGMQRTDLATACCEGTPGPLFLGIISGQKVRNGQLRGVACYLILGGDSPRAGVGDTRRLEWGITTQCNDPAIHGTAVATLGGVNRKESSELTPYYLDGPSDTVAVQGGYGDFGNGPNRAPIQFAYDQFDRTFDTQLQQIYGFVTLTIDGVDGTDGWHGATGSGSIECSYAFGRTMTCAFATVPFTSVPAATTECQVGNDTCRVIRDITAALVSLATEDPDAPAAEPATGDDEVDSESGEDLGDFYALPGDIAKDVEAGSLTLAQGTSIAAASGSPVVHCNAKISRKIGGVRYLYPDDPTTGFRRVLWWVRHTCTGLPAISFTGNSELWNAALTYFYQYGDFYDEAIPSGLDGRIRFVSRGEWLEPDSRRAKRVRWYSRIELPYEYQWISDRPFGGTSGVNLGYTSCTRSSTNPGIPKFLNKLSCTLHSYQFK